VLAGSAYPEGSAVFRALRLPEVTAAAAEYPILKRTKVKYNFIVDRWAEDVPQGFSVHLEFGSSMTDANRGMSIYSSVASGLDPPVNWDGQPTKEQFDAQDRLGEFRVWGSNSWEKGGD